MTPKEVKFRKQEIELQQKLVQMLEIMSQDLHGYRVSRDTEAIQTRLAEGAEAKRELYGIFRDYTKHEDGLINLRLNWNFTIQGFLFAAYALSVQKIVEVRGQVIKADIQLDKLDFALGIHELRFLMFVIAVLGFLVSGCVYLSVWAARLAANEIEDKWWKLNNPDSPRPAPAISFRYLLFGKYAGGKIVDNMNKLAKTHVGELPGLCGGGTSWAKQFGFHAPAALPIILTVAWGILAAYSFFTLFSHFQ
jgi:hypothetical protein